MIPPTAAIEVIARFPAVSAAGAACVIVATRRNVEATAVWMPGVIEFHTEDGRTVERLARGYYRLVATGEELRSVGEGV